MKLKNWLLAALSGSILLFVVIVAAIQHAHYLQVEEAKAQTAEATTTCTKKIDKIIEETEKSTARANMQTISNAEQSYRLASPAHVYTSNISDLTDLGSGGITGPNGRVYSVVLADTSIHCPNDLTVTAPQGSFYAQSTEVSEAFYMPRPSRRAGNSHAEPTTSN